MSEFNTTPYVHFSRIKAPKPLPEPSQINMEEFWSFVDKRGPDECWPWTGPRTGGRGTFKVNYRPLYATRIVYFLTHGEDPLEYEVRHTCDHPICVAPHHLVIGTHQQNMQDAYERGRFATGERNGNHTHPEMRPRGEGSVSSKITDEMALQIRKMHDEGMNIEAITREIKTIGKTAVNRIVKGAAWKHLGGPVAKGLLYRSGSQNVNTKLNEDAVRDIRQSMAAGSSAHDMCEKYHVTQGAIWGIIYRRTWKHVDGVDVPYTKKRQVSEDSVREIRKKQAEGVNMVALAKEYDMSLGAIRMIVHRKTWKHIK